MDFPVDILPAVTVVLLDGAVSFVVVVGAAVVGVNTECETNIS